MSENSYVKYKNNKMMWSLVIFLLQFVVVKIPVRAQQVQLPGNINVSAGGGDASGSINNVLEFIIDQMLAIGASLSVVVALGVIFAVKIGWMQRRQLMDWAWLIIAMIALPTLIPAIFSFAQASGG